MSASANLDFFAAGEDQVELLKFLFASTDVRVFESYSVPDHELREFRSVAEVTSAFPLGIDEHGNGTAVLLQLWSPSAMSEVEIERINLNPGAITGCTFRFRIGGAALMQLYLGGLCGRVITKSHFGHQSEARAKNWGVASGINWLGLKTVSNKIQYHVRRKLAVAKVPGRPVLPQALRLARDGYALKEAARSKWEHKLESLEMGPNKTIEPTR